MVALRPLLEAFQATAPGLAIEYRDLQTNDLTRAVQAACRTGGETADLVISSAIDQQVQLTNDGCAQRLESRVLARLPDWARWRGELFGITFEPAVMVYNRRLLSEGQVPRNRFELVDLLRQSEAVRGRVGTYDIELSGVGYLFASQDALQASTFGRLVEGLGRNAVRVYCCTASILDGIASGELLIGYNLLGSYALARSLADPSVGVVLPSDYTLVLARAAFVPKQAGNPAAAQRLLEFLLSGQGQRIMSEETFLLSPLNGAERLEALTGAGPEVAQALRPIALSPALLVGLDQMKRRLFLEQWRASVTAE